MKVGQLVALLEHVNLDDDIVVEVTPDLIENEKHQVERTLTFDLDKITTVVAPETYRDSSTAVYVRTVLHIRP